MKGLKANLLKNKIMFCGGITKDVMSKAKFIHVGSAA